jgi:hypothetical protein
MMSILGPGLYYSLCLEASPWSISPFCCCCSLETCAAAEDVELRRFYVFVLELVTYFSSFTLKSALS